MMNRPWPFSRRVHPRLNHFQDEKVILDGKFPIPDLAFQTGITLGDERSLDALGGHGCESKSLELVHAAARSVTASHDRFRQLHRRDVDHTFARRLKTEIGRASCR